MKINPQLTIYISLFFCLLSQSLLADTQLNTQESDFLKQHWPKSIPLQGKPPAVYSALEASLEPQHCGTCHSQQYKDWKTTLHSKAMGPGLLGQLAEMVESDPASARMCWSCHTPLAEQQEKLFIENSWQENPALNKNIQHQGLICAGCHVRNHQRFGPPPRDNSKQSGSQNSDLPHQGFTAETAFRKSAFCKGCHQFGENDYALNGKLIENTYNEWLASDYPAKGVQCQTCHMPDRRHLWRGIHDPDMVKKGVTITVDTNQTLYKKGDSLTANIRITNSAVGHYFPTYLTPKIEVLAYLVDAEGNFNPATRQKAMIGREVTLDIAQELYDTRIPPNETLTIAYNQKITAENLRLHIKATVYPDHFYTRFYESMLESDIAGRGAALIEQALEASKKSSFTLFEKTIPLGSQRNTIQIKTFQPSQTHGTPTTDRHQPDWNAEQIQWFDYEEGFLLSNQNGKPVMLVFYADWCPTCHAYKDIFSDPRIVAQAKNLVMIRVNVDRSPQFSNRYINDGDYVPRTFALNSQGRQVSKLFAKRNYPKHFISANSPETFLTLMKQMQP